MKFCFLLALVLCAAASAEDVSPHIARIEIFGARKVSAQKIRNAIGAKPGDSLPSREGVEERIDKIPGVVASRLEAVCCEEGNLILYVGVQEKDAPHFEFHPPPSGSVKLPDGLVDLYHSLLDNIAASIRGHNADQDLTNGYSLMADPDSRAIQLKMIPLVARDLAVIDQVVRNSADPDQRAAAAYLLQYSPRDRHSGQIMVNALQYALRDADDNVRANAVRALHAVMVGAKLHPEQHLRIEPTWYVQMMNSVVWSDRRDASLALVNLTDNRDPDTLELIRERALGSVIDMAGWHDLDHALPGFILAGRIAGLDEKQIQAAWLSGNREPVLEKARRAGGKRNRISSLLPGN
ncbi:MAG: hypothetical protein ACRD4O_15225 [Bryobacteraceae bacterium]